MRTFRRRAIIKSNVAPTVSVIISAYNEEKHIYDRLSNLDTQNYPSDKIEFLIGSDGSTDATNEIISKYSSDKLKAFLFEKRRGKTFVLNDLAPKSNNEILVFSDANTIFQPDTIKNLVNHFADPTVGAVCGELILKIDTASTGGLGEGSYWNYENRLKKYESDIKTTLTGTGAVYAIRKNLYIPLPTGKLVADDMMIPLNALKQGYRIIYEPRALAYEATSDSVAVEFRRKARIGASNLYGLVFMGSLLNPMRGFVSYALFSHKIVRWAIPLLLIFLFISSLVLIDTSIVYSSFVILETIILFFALIGLIAEQSKIHIGVLGIPYYFLAMNAGLLFGYLKLIFGIQRNIWTVERK